MKAAKTGYGMLDLQTIGEDVRAARKAKRLTQSALGEIAGVSRAQIERLENGRAADMGFGLVLRLVRAVGLDLSLQAYNHGRPTLDDLVAENPQ
jgi:transcriptional regulator with XRE-family HTH domain